MSASVEIEIPAMISMALAGDHGHRLEQQARRRRRRADPAAEAVLDDGPRPERVEDAEQDRACAPASVLVAMAGIGDAQEIGPQDALHHYAPGRASSSGSGSIGEPPSYQPGAVQYSKCR